jgi:hypothetical protein
LVVQLSYEDWWIDPKVIPPHIYRMWHQNYIPN